MAKRGSKKSSAPSPLSHLDQRGQARMVDVSGKALTERIARAEGKVIMRKETLDKVIAGNALKGDVLTAARLAGIMAAKRTHSLIPLCHPLPLTDLVVQVTPDRAAGLLRIRAEAATTISLSIAFAMS